MPQRGKHQKISSRTAISTAAERLFVGLAAVAAMQVSAYAQEAATQTSKESAQSAASPDGAGAAVPQSTVLPAIAVNATASPGELPAPYAGGQVARGGSIGVLGTAN